MSTRIPTHVAVLAALVDHGKTAFNIDCRTCHLYKNGDNRLGPSLHGIVGAKAGQVKCYNAYSGLTGFSWDEAVLYKFLASRTSVAPNTNMNYPPVADAATRPAYAIDSQAQAAW